MPVHQEPTQSDLGIIGRSPQMLALIETIRRVAPTDIGVLLVGESGVGKEVIASAIHALSRRHSKRMIAINCGAIPETLLESELFGHERGAFTGAVESRKGLFEAADGGTIFLDEIGEMSLSTQVKLLRVLETLEFTRVGSTDTRRSDVRIIAATNRDLARDVLNGTFRQDLYYRLRPIQLRIPPLRERREDIPLLVAHFVRTSSERIGIDPPRFTPEALEILVGHRWAGNIRELKHFIELLVTLEGERDITADAVLRHLDLERHGVVDNPNAIVHLAGRTPEQAERELMYRALIELRNEVGGLRQAFYSLASQFTQSPARAALPSAEEHVEAPFERLAGFSLEEVERGMILAALKRYNGNRRHAARALGISERTLYRKLNEYRLESSSSEGDPTESSASEGSTPENAATQSAASTESESGAPAQRSEESGDRGVRALSEEEWQAMKTRTEP